MSDSRCYSRVERLHLCGLRPNSTLLMAECDINLLPYLVEVWEPLSLLDLPGENLAQPLHKRLFYATLFYCLWSCRNWSFDTWSVLGGGGQIWTTPQKRDNNDYILTMTHLYFLTWEYSTIKVKHTHLTDCHHFSAWPICHLCFKYTQLDLWMVLKTL